MVPLEDQLILSTKGCLLVLMKLGKRQVSSGDTTIVDLPVGGGVLRGTTIPAQHLLHKMSGRKLERVSLLVGGCHRYVLRLLHLNVEHFLSGNPVCQECLPVSLSSDT